MVTHVHSVPIVVSEYERALNFYRGALGFEVTADVTDPRSSENRWLTLKPKHGQTSVMLLTPSTRQPNLSSRLGKPTYVVLSCDDIYAECGRINSHGGRALHEPKVAGWGRALEAHFADPDGNIFQLIQSLGDS